MRTFATATLILLTACAGAGGLLLGASLPAGAISQALPLSAHIIPSTPTPSVAPISSAERSKSAQMIVPASTDIGFAQSMIAHHNQALLLAMMVQNHPSETIRGMAQNIRLKQTHENGMMLGWLSAWDAAPMALDAMAWVNQTTLPLSAEDVLFISRCSANPGQMPGQVSASEMEKLQKATPDEQARMFLQYMKRHHEAALDMAAFATRHTTLPFVRSFALSVIREQGREIAWMSRQLATSQTF